MMVFRIEFNNCFDEGFGMFWVYVWCNIVFQVKYVVSISVEVV